MKPYFINGVSRAIFNEARVSRCPPNFPPEINPKLFISGENHLSEGTGERVLLRFPADLTNP